jgi:hypothetical protein
LAQQGIAEIKDRRRSKAEAELRGKVDTANTNITKLLIHQSELLAALSTNNAIDPKLRVEILEHSRAVELASMDGSVLEGWKTNLKNEQAAAKQKEEVARLKDEISLAEETVAKQERFDRTRRRAIQYYDFMIRTLQTTVQDIAKSRGEKVFSDYRGLPVIPVGCNGNTHVATITTGTNLGWWFDLSACGGGTSVDAFVWLYVQGYCSNRLDKNQYTGYYTKFTSSETLGNPGSTNVTAESYLYLTPTHCDFRQRVNVDGYETNILAWVHRFVAAHAIRCDGR